MGLLEAGVRAWLVALLLVIAAFLPRAVGLAQFATWDELFWTHATLRFWRAVDAQRWSRTYIIGQPGVVSMWMGSAPLTWRLARATCRAAASKTGRGCAS